MPPPPPSSALSLVHTSLVGLDWPGQSLRWGATAVDFDAVSHEQRRALAAGLIGAMSGPRPGVGLAAPMTGLGLRVIVVSHDGRVLVMANPELVATHGEAIALPEANLSLPRVSAKVRRPEGVTVAWQSLNSGRTAEETFSGWPARIVQHELDLLDGRMFTDLAAAGAIRQDTPPDRRAAEAAAAFLGDEGELPHSGDVPLNVITLPPALAGVGPSVLRRAAGELDPAAFAPGDLRALVRAMFQLQYEHGGVGLAAPQVGLSVRLAVIDNGEDPPLVLVNPEVLDASDELEVAAEGCLSIPGWRGLVERPTRIAIRNHTAAGEPFEVELEGYAARIVQHEMDHLAGVLYTDRMAAGEPLTPDGPQVRAEMALQALHKEEAAGSAQRRAQAQRR